MKQYPSISHKIQNISAYAFDKLDGSNIRAEWCSKKGFWKFGSRTRLLGTDQENLHGADILIQEKYGNDLTKIFKEQRHEKVIAFFEYYGFNSFAGHHDDKEQHTVTLIDVNPYKKGILQPDEFVKIYGHLDIPKLLYKGNINQIFIDDVRQSKLENLTFEGVVCKAKSGNNVSMFKIKTIKWLEKLKEHCKGNQQLFEQLM